MPMRAVVRLQALVLFLLAVAPSQAQDLVINEIMYNPYSRVLGAEDIHEEFVELYNQGNHRVDLSGWRFTKGVAFTFPSVVMEPGGYLVVASDVATFKAKYPGVEQVVGNWTGRLSNSGETIELRDGNGNLVDEVPYADEGDWGVRELGPSDYGHRGWQWQAEHDGGGKSLELVNPAMPNEYGGNWAASADDGGTPGRANSTMAMDIAPLVVDLQHAPLIAGPSDTVRVRARVIDESSTGLVVRLRYRIDRSTYQGSNVYPARDGSDTVAVDMFDDGNHNDGAANDGLCAAQIPSHPDGTVIEFYVEARDSGGKVRTWPAPSWVDGQPLQVTNALYRVDAAFDPATYWTLDGQPLYYMVMTEMERGRLAYIGAHSNDAYSHAQMNGTFISVDGEGLKCRYCVGIRNRGKGSRTPPPNNYRVNFPDDRPWKHVTEININSKYTYLQVLAQALFKMSDLPTQDARRVQVRVNGENLSLSDPSNMYGSYVCLEVYDSDWADNHLPDDNAVNLYRCLSDASPRRCDLQYLGSDPALYSQPNYYAKATNTGVNDWSDLIHLTYVLDQSPDDTYVQDVEQTVNVDQWLRWMASQMLIVNYETNLSSGYGDDYYLCRGVEDPRFILLPYDPGLENILNGSNVHASIWLLGRMDSLPVVKRFLTQPEFVPRYYAQLKELAETVFSPEQFDPLIDKVLGAWVPQNRIGAMKAFMAARTAYVLSVIPQTFAIDSDLPISGAYCVTSSPVLEGQDLHGTFDATRTYSVTIDGQTGEWSPRDGLWSMGRVRLDLQPGINRIYIEAFDGPSGTGNKIDEGTIDVQYDDGTLSEISGTIQVDTVLQAASGPWHVTGPVSVSNGATLRIERGTTLFFEPTAGITIKQGGRLLAEGSAYQHIRFTRLPGSAAPWFGIKFDHTLEDNRLSYADIEYGDDQGESVNVQFSRILIDHVTWSGTNTRILTVDHPTATIRDSVFPSIDSTEPIHGMGLSEGESLVFERCTFGSATGYNDIIDFTGGRKPGPILQVYDSLFLGGSDDALDLDGTDAYIEGTVFTNFHHVSSSDSSSNAIATGSNAGYSSQIDAVRNVFIGNDHAVLLKEDCFLHAQNNTFVDSTLAAINFGEPERNPPRTPGKGAYLANSIFWNNAAIFEDYFEEPLPEYGPEEVVVDYSLIPAQWHDLGQGDIDADPLFVNPYDWRLQSISAARGAGLWGLDMGAYVPAGAAVADEPGPLTYRTDATLTVGGPGITDYKYSVNDPNGPWSEERSVDVPISLTGLQNGSSYTVYVLGKNSAGRWQTQPNASRTWTVDRSFRQVVINEVLALNTTAYEHEGTFPDLVELYYDGPGVLSLAGMSITDDPCQPKRFVFPQGTSMNPGDYLVLFADSDATTSGIHLGFGLAAEGDGLYLYAADGTLLDSVEFGRQLPDLSIGRTGRDGNWSLTVPTFGFANVSQPLGDPTKVKINEWLANGQVLFDRDFVELYNPGSFPVDIGGFYLTDNTTAPSIRHKLRPLTFISQGGFAAFEAHGDSAGGQAGFKLSVDGDLLGLFDPGLREVDRVLYGPQTSDVSQGRNPDGSDRIGCLILPTPGMANLGMPEATSDAVTLVPEDAPKRAIVPTSASEVASDWNSRVDFDDSSWLSGSGAPGGVGYERGTGYESLISLDVQDQMYNKNTSCYIRIPFQVDGAVLDNLGTMTFSIRCDDGFVAWLNGVEIARMNCSAAQLQWNSAADGAYEAQVYAFDEVVDISDRIGLLHKGVNLLAIQGLNTSRTSSDLIISVLVDGTIKTVPPEDFPYPEALKLLDGLRITELMYHAPGGENEDYIELQNISTETLNLEGVRFTKGIDFTFPAMTLDPGRYVLVVSDAAAFDAAYGTSLPIAGQYTGHLGNGGEDIVLTLPLPLDAAILRFHYDDKWYPVTDGGGQSLTVRDVTAAPVTWMDPDSWRASDPTPGRP
jgi:hypothetical protein